MEQESISEVKLLAERDREKLLEKVYKLMADGFGINRTMIEEGAYIGSGCELVAPLKVNSNATVASGSTITDEVAGDALTIARSRQVTIEDWQRPKSRKGSSK